MQDNRGGFKKSTIVILIICGIMILAGAGIATAGIALDGLHDLKNINIAGHDINIHGTEPLAESTVSIEPFKNMDIKAEGSRVVIVDDSEFYVKARYAPGDEPLIDVQDGTLYVQDYAAIQGGSVGFTGSPDAPTGIRLTDGSGSEVTLDGDGIVIQGEDGDNVTINGLGINIHTSDDIDEDDIGSVPIDINIDGFDGSVSYEQPSIEIHCPMSEAYGTVAVSGSAAEMSLDGMQAESLVLDVYSGGIVLRNAKIGSIAGTLSYGEFTLDACTTDAIELTGDATNVSVTGTTVTNAAVFNGSTSGETMTVKDSTFGALTINATEDSSTDLQMNGVTVTGDVSLHAPYGTHEISNSTFGTFTCKSDNSELDLANVTVSGAVQIEQNYSDIEMENCTLNGLTAKVLTGDFEFKGALTGATVITITESGDVDLAITGNEADYIYALNSEFGEVLVNGKPYKATVDKGTGANTIQVDVESGDIELNFL
jgi:hypothetical protein